MSEQETLFLKQAKKFLEQPGWAIRLADKVGKPIEWAMDNLPAPLRQRIQGAAQTGIEHAFAIALKTLSPEKTIVPAQMQDVFQANLNSSKLDRLTQGLVLSGTGAIGGFLGTAGTIIEIPISTSLMMRDMLRQGMAFGIADTSELITESLYLFTYGGETSKDDAANSAYFGARLAYHELIRESGQFIAQQGTKALLESMQKGTAPILVRLIARIAARFNVPLTEKVLAQAMPVVGALGGATINSLFADYYHNLAYYHFGIKNLEKRYGDEVIRQVYLEYKTTDKV